MKKSVKAKLPEKLSGDILADLYAGLIFRNPLRELKDDEIALIIISFEEFRDNKEYIECVDSPSGFEFSLSINGISQAREQWINQSIRRRILKKFRII